jgi:hypothetical protein
LTDGSSPGLSPGSVPTFGLFLQLQIQSRQLLLFPHPLHRPSHMKLMPQPPFSRPPIRPHGWLRGLPQKRIPSSSSSPATTSFPTTKTSRTPANSTTTRTKAPTSTKPRTPRPSLIPSCLRSTASCPSLPSKSNYGHQSQPHGFQTSSPATTRNNTRSTIRPERFLAQLQMSHNIEGSIVHPTRTATRIIEKCSIDGNGQELPVRAPTENHLGLPFLYRFYQTKR